MKNKLIFLIGFMTAGKSTIGKILANTIGWNFIDLDEEIERTLNKPINRIFKENGETYFRDVENQVLDRISKKNKFVISLGGGTLEAPENMKIISSNGIIIYLEVSIIEAFKRLKYKRNRPVLFNNSDEFVSDDELLNRITKIYNKRLALYNKADLKINTDKMNVGKTVDLLRIILKKDFGIE